MDEAADLNPQYRSSVGDVLNTVLIAEGRPERLTAFPVPAHNFQPDFLMCTLDGSRLGAALVCGVGKVRVHLRRVYSMGGSSLLACGATGPCTCPRRFQAVVVGPGARVWL